MSKKYVYLIALVLLIVGGFYVAWNYHFFNYASTYPSEYEIDANGVYLLTSPKMLIPGADPKSFVVLTPREYGADQYAKDAARVYYADTPIASADPATFVAFNQNFAEDKNQAYSQGVAIPGVDLGSFTALSFSYAKDSKYMYVSATKILLGADLGTFTVLNSAFAKDSARVYYDNQIIPGADSQTFHITFGGASDKNHSYSTQPLTGILEIDGKTTELSSDVGDIPGTTPAQPSTSSASTIVPAPAPTLEQATQNATAKVPACTLVANPSTPQVGQSVEVHWSVTANADSATLSVPGTGDVKVSQVNDGTYVFTINAAGTYQFSLNATGPGGTGTCQTEVIASI